MKNCLIQKLYYGFKEIKIWRINFWCDMCFIFY